MTNKLQIIGISGKAESGKDYIAQHYFRPAGYTPFSFAWHMKIWVVGRKMASHEEVFFTKPPVVRSLLQQEGTEKGRNVYGEDVWINTMLEWMNVLNENCGLNKFIVPDVRFPNEAEAIQAAGGRVFRIQAPKRSANNKLSPQARLHISETALDNWKGFDDLIYNDPEHSETIGRQLQRLLPEESFMKDEDELNFFQYLREWWNGDV